MTFTITGMNLLEYYMFAYYARPIRLSESKLCGTHRVHMMSAVLQCGMFNYPVYAKVSSGDTQDFPAG